MIDKGTAAFRQSLPFRNGEDDPEVGNGDGVAVDRVAMAWNPAIRAEVGIQMSDQLVTEHVKVDPGDVAAPFGKPQFFSVEFAGFIDVANLNGEMKWS